MTARIGVVGLGLMGTEHSKRLEDAGGRIVGGADISSDARTSFAAEFDTDTYEDYEALYAAGVDAVVLTLPNAFHEEAAVAALERNIHVLVEKPVAHTLESAERIADAASSSDAFCMTGFTMRFYPVVEELVERATRGDFGAITHVDARYLRRNMIPYSGWFVDPDLAGGGALVDVGVHVLDIALASVDFPDFDGVYGRTSTDRFDIDVEAASTALLRSTDDVTIVLDVEWATPGEPEKSIIIRGTEGAAHLDLNEGTLTVYGDPDTDEANPTTIETPDTDWLAPEDEAFLDAVRRGSPPDRSTVEEGLAVQRVIDAVYRSAESGSAVRPR